MSRDVIEVAKRLGFRAVPCASCNPLIDAACANCEGVGWVWRSLDATVARSGLLRLGGEERGD